MKIGRHLWRTLGALLLSAAISTSAVAQSVATRLVNAGAATTSIKILPGGTASMDVRLDIDTAAIIGTGFTITQLTPAGSGFFSITGRSFAGSPFTDTTSGTSDATVLAAASALLDPANNENLGRTTVGLVGIPPANNVLAVNLTLAASGATPLGFYRIGPTAGLSFATDTSFNDYAMSGGTPFTIIVGQTLTVTKRGAGTGTVGADSGAINCGVTCSDIYPGTVVTLTATPTGGSTFAGWTSGGCSGTGTCVVTVDAAKTVTAAFTADMADTTVNLNQHGLTGSWYEPATSGQGFEVEVFPDLSAPGTGLVQVSWFTYDTVSGGAERQRWYTAQGDVETGQSSASLTIYRNTGGNFNAPPVTSSQVVGTATLSFDTCASGQLSYAFTDGTGRAGTIPLTRLTQNVTCSTIAPYPTNADFALSGNWYDPATSGQGFTVEVNPISSTVFAAWYTYAPSGAGAGAAGQRWYTAQPTATFAPGSRSIPVQIFETTGGVFDTPTPPGQNTVQFGTGTMTFQSCSAATFSYNFTGGSSAGLSGTINLTRVGPLPPGCTT